MRLDSGGLNSDSYYLWQSQIEIEYYSVAYFERITEFDAGLGGAHTRFVDASDIHAFT